MLSNSLTKVPEGYEDKVILVKGNIQSVLTSLHEQGLKRIYVDGGNVIQQCLAEDLIDELVIATIPVLLGKGIPLFGELAKPLAFEHQHTTKHIDAIVQNTYLRVRD
ncbi:dihydrofolate reductase family protein [Thaumasiovibrio subtropicus]|uniref:dihydrofolate reductase family protein n=1 Tax=Thaumasiovibrio subtropicus TaxID=1891207 RepID=UPI00131C2183|nr:dihydrofolate reductase family protein [Thaumasiovibrio subtropicus]